MTGPDVLFLLAIKRRAADRHHDPVQVRLDRDWLIGRLEEAHATIRDLRRALGDIEILAGDARNDAYAAQQLARMARTNEVVPS